jgi:F-type H+-transporting ATPase subunit delta
MYRSLIAIRYAKALFLKAKEEEVLEKIHDDIDLINKSFEEYPELHDVLFQPSIVTTKKRKIIDDIYEDYVHPITLDFLELILQNKRERHIDDIFRNFNDIYNEDMGIKSAILTTTVELGKSEQKAIEEFIKNNFDANEIDLEVLVDKEILGGFIIQINDQLFDASIRRQLDLIKRKFLYKKINSH